MFLSDAFNVFGARENRMTIQNFRGLRQGFTIDQLTLKCTSLV